MPKLDPIGFPAKLVWITFGGSGIEHEEMANQNLAY